MKERQLENWICNHWDDDLYPSPWIGATLIGRQVQLPNGICDLLAMSYVPTIIELKAGRLKEKDVGQILRYAHDVSMILRDINHAFGDEIVTLAESKFNLNIEPALSAFLSTWALLTQVPVAEAGIAESMRLILIGQSIDENALISATGGHIEIWLWKYDEGQDLFSFRQQQHESRAIKNPRPHWADALEQLIFDDAAMTAQMYVPPPVRWWGRGSLVRPKAAPISPHPSAGGVGVGCCHDRSDV